MYSAALMEVPYRAGIYLTGSAPAFFQLTGRYTVLWKKAVVFLLAAVSCGTEVGNTALLLLIEM